MFYFLEVPNLLSHVMPESRCCSCERQGPYNPFGSPPPKSSGQDIEEGIIQRWERNKRKNKEEVKKIKTKDRVKKKRSMAVIAEKMKTNF
jgi:hypothetical protein